MGDKSAGGWRRDGEMRGGDGRRDAGRKG
jgi:hypothetical protein